MRSTVKECLQGIELAYNYHWNVSFGKNERKAVIEIQMINRPSSWGGFWPPHAHLFGSKVNAKISCSTSTRHLKIPSYIYV